MTAFSTFGEVAANWRANRDVFKASDEALKAGSTAMQDWIKKQHGGGGTKPRSGPLQSKIKGHSRPLYQSGGLRAGVLLRKKQRNVTEIYQKNTEWAHVHEYGAVWSPGLKQSNKLRGLIRENLGISTKVGSPIPVIRIPPRPTWSRAVPEYGEKTYNIMKKILRKHLTN